VIKTVRHEVRRLLSDRTAAAGIPLEPPVSEAFEAYYELLTHWNNRINLTALPLENPVEGTIDRLFIEPLVAANAVLEGARSWVDLGSGGGSPAIPMKVLYTGVALTMVESKTRKAAFLREAVRELELAETTVAETRFEDLADNFKLRDTSDVVTVRAVRPDQTLFGTAASVLKAGGKLAIFTSFGVQTAASGDFSIGETLSLTTSAGLAIYRRRSVPRGTKRLT